MPDTASDTTLVSPDPAAPLRRRLSEIDPADAFVFLDFDGTLVDIAATPDGIDVPATLAPLLSHLAIATRGLALVSGRTVAELRGFLPGLDATFHGCHGAEMWNHDGSGHYALIDGVDARDIATLHARTAALAGTDPALLAEAKPSGAVLHYRRAPHRAADMTQAMEVIAADFPAFELHPAKMALELRPRHVGKDRVVASTLAARSGAIPLYAGDDLTDEPAMDVVRAAGGIAIKVGTGDSVAPWRLAAPAEVLALLADWSGHAP